MDETAPSSINSHALISSAMVEGTPVFDPQGEKLGKVHSVMIHKQTGQVAYAVLAFASFLHFDRHVHAIPWEKLSYDENRRGYVIDIPREVLDQAPVLTLDESDRPREWTEEDDLAIKTYYSLPF